MMWKPSVNAIWLRAAPEVGGEREEVGHRTRVRPAEAPGSTLASSPSISAL